MAETVLALGLMSGTSLDGVDAALIETDGVHIQQFGPWLTLPYDAGFRARLRAAIAGQEDVPHVEHELTLRHASAVQALLKESGLAPRDVRIIGFHGQTIIHRPKEHITWQIGNGALLAEETGIDVACDFRRADMAAGGQGAPLVPLFHAALAEALPKPAAILNIGGVANVTWIGRSGEMLAFDTGPGCALINDVVHRSTGAECDEGGRIAAQGTPDEALLTQWMADAYFAEPPHKSLDRNHFSSACVAALSLPNAAATLTEFTARSVEASAQHFPEKPHCWYVCGGGRHNPALLRALANRLGNVRLVDEHGWSGDALEAQAFAYFAVRCMRGLSLTLPSTTGVSRPISGGTVYRYFP